jgi:hypothetical protein
LFHLGGLLRITVLTKYTALRRALARSVLACDSAQHTASAPAIDSVQLLNRFSSPPGML